MAIRYRHKEGSGPAARVLLFGVTLAIIFLCFCNWLPALALPERVKVRLFEARETVPEVKINGVGRIISPLEKPLRAREGGYLLKVDGGQVGLYMVSRQGRDGSASRLPRVLRSSRIILESDDPRGLELIFPGRSPCRYSGALSFSVGRSGGRNSLDVVNDVSVREFVYGIVASELPLSFHPEAKKALAVLTLTRLEFLPDRRAIGDSTKSELYTGCGRVTNSLRELVDQVFGQRLYFKGHLVLPYYHSTCSGATSDGKELFRGNGEDLGYLQAVKCEHCKKSPFYDFKTAIVPGNKIRDLFNGALPVVRKRDPFGRPLSVKVQGVKGDLSGYKAWITLGRGLGWGKIPGTRFYLRDLAQASSGKEQSPNESQSRIEIRSSGAGHGVGLCQWGAHGLACGGRSYREILSFYFPRAKVK